MKARELPMHFRCPDCGPHVGVDEDGCCFTCGADTDSEDCSPACPPHPAVTAVVCGPQSAKCKCQCPDGSCEHKWDGPAESFEGCTTTTCSRCGMTAMGHDMWVL